MGISRRCPSCQGLFTGPRCPKCATRYSTKRQKDNSALKLYGSYKWAQCRRDVRLRYYDYDIWLLGIGELRRCDKTYIHHIIERDEAPDLQFAIDNLITVSYESHNEIHEAYKSDKAAALTRIREGIRRFKEMFEE